jgi:hypothetical protein
MVKPLFANQRRWLLRTAVAACAMTLLLAPLIRPVRFEANAANRPPVGTFPAPAVPEQLKYPVFSVARDPFVPPGTPNLPPLGADGTLVLPPNDVIDAAPVVRAIVRGASPRALIDTGGRVQMVGIGDTVSGAKITAIDARGIVLDDGETLPFVGQRP